MTHLLRLEPKWIVVLDAEDEERMIDRQHYEQWLKDKGWFTTLYWDYIEFNNLPFIQDVELYLSQHHTLNTI